MCSEQRICWVATKFKLWLIQPFLFLFLTPKPFCTGGNVLKIRNVDMSVGIVDSISRTLPPVQKGFGVKNKNKNSCINHSLNFVPSFLLEATLNVSISIDIK